TSAGCSAGSTIERRSRCTSPLTPITAGWPNVRPPAGVMTASKSGLVAISRHTSTVEATYEPSTGTYASGASARSRSYVAYGLRSRSVIVTSSSQDRSGRSVVVIAASSHVVVRDGADRKAVRSAPTTRFARTRHRLRGWSVTRASSTLSAHARTAWSRTAGLGHRVPAGRGGVLPSRAPAPRRRPRAAPHAAHTRPRAGAD